MAAVFAALTLLLADYSLARALVMGALWGACMVLLSWWADRPGGLISRIKADGASR